MGMYLSLTLLGDANISRILSDPPLIWLVLAPDDPEIYHEARRDEAKPTFLAKLFKRNRTPLPIELTGLEGRSEYFDKAWHGIHYLLTGTVDAGSYPQSFIMNGGSDIDTTDLGYGPARAFTASQTIAINDMLTAITDDDLMTRFDPSDMLAKQIYPDIWDRPPEDDDTLGYLIEHVQLLRSFLREAVDNNLGFVIEIG